MQAFAIEESYPDENFPGQAAPPVVPPNRPNGGWYSGYVPPPGTPWGSVPVTPSVTGMMERLRVDGGNDLASYHYASGSVRPGNHLPPADVVPCGDVAELCMPAYAGDRDAKVTTPEPTSVNFMELMAENIL